MPSNSQFYDEEIYQKIASLVRNFKLLQCAECAEAIKKWLKANGINGTHLQLSNQTKLIT